MYDDLISVLREIANSKGGSNINMPMLLTEAADAIEELVMENQSFAKTINMASDWLHRRQEREES